MASKIVICFSLLLMVFSLFPLAFAGPEGSGSKNEGCVSMVARGDYSFVDPESYESYLLHQAFNLRKGTFEKYSIIKQTYFSISSPFRTDYCKWEIGNSKAFFLGYKEEHFSEEGDWIGTIWKNR